MCSRVVIKSTQMGSARSERLHWNDHDGDQSTVFLKLDHFFCFENLHTCACQQMKTLSDPSSPRVHLKYRNVPCLPKISHFNDADANIEMVR